MKLAVLDDYQRARAQVRRLGAAAARARSRYFMTRFARRRGGSSSWRRSRSLPDARAHAVPARADREAAEAEVHQPHRRALAEPRHAALKARGIPVSNTRSAGGGRSTAELAWGLILAAARDLAKAERNMRAGRWHEGLAPGFSLDGKTPRPARPGQDRRARRGDRKAFGMECVAWSQNLTRREGAAPQARARVQRKSCSRTAISSPSTWCSATARAAWSAPQTSR